MLPYVFAWNATKNTMKLRSMRGLTPTLSAAFYPVYRFRLARKGPTTPKELYKGGPSGTRLGKRLDRELHHFRLKRRRPTLPHALSVLELVKKRGEQVVFTQLPVFDKDLRMCTKIDLLIKNEFRFTAVEIKVGYAHYRHKHTGSNMRFPFEKLTDSPFNQHLLQTFGSQLLFRSTYPKTPVSAELWYVSEKGVVVHQIPEDMKCKAGAMKAVLELSREETRKDRSKVKRAALRKHKKPKKK